MNKTYVYLVLSEKRLLISMNKINGNNYHLLMNVDGCNYNARQLCKMFCIGYIMGNNTPEYKIVNNAREFV